MILYQLLFLSRRGPSQPGQLLCCRVLMSETGPDQLHLSLGAAHGWVSASPTPSAVFRAVQGLSGTPSARTSPVPLPPGAPHPGQV